MFVKLDDLMHGVFAYDDDTGHGVTYCGRHVGPHDAEFGEPVTCEECKELSALSGTLTQEEMFGRVKAAAIGKDEYLSGTVHPLISKDREIDERKRHVLARAYFGTSGGMMHFDFGFGIHFSMPITSKLYAYVHTEEEVGITKWKCPKCGNQVATRLHHVRFPHWCEGVGEAVKEGP